MYIIVFGCGNIGLSVTKALCEESQVEKVIVISRSKSTHLSELISLHPKYKNKIEFSQVDAQNEVEVERVLQPLVQQIDVAIITTGSYTTTPMLQDFNQFSIEYENNVLSMIVPIQKILSCKILKNKGRMIAISSTSSQWIPKRLTAYSISKWALDNFLTSIQQLKMNQAIEIDVIRPGMIKKSYSKTFGQGENGIDANRIAKLIWDIICKRKTGKIYSISRLNGFNGIKYTFQRICTGHLPQEVYHVRWIEWLSRYVEEIKHIINRKKLTVPSRKQIHNVLVIGNQTGFGLEVAKLFARQNKKVFVFDDRLNWANYLLEENLKKNISIIPIMEESRNNYLSYYSFVDNVETIDILINDSIILDDRKVLEAAIDDLKITYSNIFLRNAYLFSVMNHKSKMPDYILNIFSTSFLSDNGFGGIRTLAEVSLWSLYQSVKKIYPSKKVIDIIVPYEHNGESKNIVSSRIYDWIQDNGKIDILAHQVTTSNRSFYFLTIKELWYFIFHIFIKKR